MMFRVESLFLFIVAEKRKVYDPQRTKGVVLRLPIVLRFFLYRVRLLAGNEAQLGA